MPKISKVLLVHCAHYDSHGKLVQAKGILNRLTSVNVEKLGLLLIAALTPSHIDVEKVEEYFRDVDFNTDAEVIGIHAQVMQVGRAIDLAREFKRRGKIVIMGGYLPTMHPELIENEVDAYCIGEGEAVWPQMISDIENNCLKKSYKADKQFPLEKLPVPRYDLVDKSRMVVYPIQATRGCPFTCDYCSIIEFFERTYRYRPIQDIVRDIKATRSRQIFFADDNMMENKKYVKDLFRSMSGLKVMWGTQTTITISQDQELLNLAYRAGCMFVAVGMESISQKNLNDMSKGFNRVDQFEEAVKKIQRSGIAVHALIVFGLPEDTKETFDQTVEYLEKLGVAVAEFFIYTPYPATPAGKRVFEEDKIIDRDLNHFRETYVVFKHPHMSSEEIIKGYWRAYKKFYSLKSIMRRIWRGEYKRKPYHLVSNIYYMIKIKRGIVPVYHGKGNDVPIDVS